MSVALHLLMKVMAASVATKKASNHNSIMAILQWSISQFFD